MSIPALRPMTVGDILDQSFSLYRKNFVTLAGIVAIIHVPLMALQIIGSLLFGVQPASPFGRFGPGSFPQTQTPAMLGGLGILALTGIVAIIAQVFETSALSVVVSERLLGNTITLRQAYGRALSRWRALLAMLLVTGGATLVLFIALFVPFLVLAVATGLFVNNGSSSAAGGLLGALIVCVTCVAFPIVLIGIYSVSVRLLFAPQAIVLEKMGGLDGLRRSWRLVRGSFWRVLGITLMVGILVAIIGQGPAYVIAIVANVLPFPAIGIVLNTATQAVLTIIVLPLQFAAITLLYYDLRIRKEGFDLQLMAQQLTPTFGGLAADSSAEAAPA